MRHAENERRRRCTRFQEKQKDFLKTIEFPEIEYEISDK